MPCHSLCCTPTFQAMTCGGSKSYAVGYIVRVGSGSPPEAERSWRRPHCRLRLKHARGVVDLVEHHAALGAVVEDPEAAADDRLPLAREVVHDAEPGRHAEGVAALHRVVDPLAGLEGPVEPVRAGHEAPDEPDATVFASVGVVRRRQEPGPFRAGCAARAGIRADADGGVEPRGVGGVEPVGQEGGRLEGLVPLRRQVVEADAVVEREPLVAFQLSWTYHSKLS